MPDPTRKRMTSREQSVWDAAFAAAFVAQAVRDYDLTQQMDQKSRLYGMSLNECALEEAEENASVARSIANAAVYGLRLTESELRSTILDDLKCLESTKSEIEKYKDNDHA